MYYFCTYDYPIAIDGFYDVWKIRDRRTLGIINSYQFIKENMNSDKNLAWKKCWECFILLAFGFWAPPHITEEITLLENLWAEYGGYLHHFMNHEISLLYRKQRQGPKRLSIVLEEDTKHAHPMPHSGI